MMHAAPALCLLRRWRPLTLAMALLSPAVWAAAPFHDNGDGTVTDTSTGLMWDQCAWGQAGPGCAGLASRHDWADALAQARQANTVAHRGHTDWRLPNIRELGTLFDVTKAVRPALDHSVFLNAPSSDVWSSTPLAPAVGSPVSYARALNMLGGDSFIGFENALPVRLVRSGTGATRHDALDTTPPVITEASAAATSPFQAYIHMRGSERLEVFWLVQPATSAPPTTAVMQSSANVMPLEAGDGNDSDPGGLTPGADYVAYFWPRDTAGNWATFVTSRAFSTPVAAQTLQFNALPDVSYGSAIPALAATASSGLAVSFASASAGVCTVTGNSVTLIAAGRCTIEATQAGNSGWSAAPPVQQGFNVNAVPPGAPAAPGASVGDGQVTLVWSAPALTGGSIVTYSVDGGPGGPHACTSPCVMSGLANGTPYSFTVTARNSAGPGGVVTMGPYTPHAGVVASATAIPTLGQWALIVMSALLAMLGIGSVRSRNHRQRGQQG